MDYAYRKTIAKPRQLWSPEEADLVRQYELRKTFESRAAENERLEATKGQAVSGLTSDLGRGVRTVLASPVPPAYRPDSFAGRYAQGVKQQLDERQDLSPTQRFVGGLTAGMVIPPDAVEMENIARNPFRVALENPGGFVGGPAAHAAEAASRAVALSKLRTAGQAVAKAGEKAAPVARRALAEEAGYLKLPKELMGQRIRQFTKPELQAEWEALRAKAASQNLDVDALAGPRPDQFYFAVTPKKQVPGTTDEFRSGMRVKVPKSLQQERFFADAAGVNRFLDTGEYAKPSLKFGASPGEALYKTGGGEGTPLSRMRPVEGLGGLPSDVPNVAKLPLAEREKLQLLQLQRDAATKVAPSKSAVAKAKAAPQAPVPSAPAGAVTPGPVSRQPVSQVTTPAKGTDVVRPAQAAPATAIKKVWRFAGEEPVEAATAAEARGILEARAGHSLEGPITPQESEVARASATPQTEPSTPLAQGLPRELAGAKARYNIGLKSWSPQFESDVDKALFIVSQATPSRRNADYLAWLRGQFPGRADTDIVKMGRQVRQNLKGIISNQPVGSVNIPDQGLMPKAPKPATRQPRVVTPKPAPVVEQTAAVPSVVEPPKPVRKPIWAMAPEEAEGLASQGARTETGAGRPPPGGIPPPGMKPPAGPPSSGAFPSGRKPGQAARADEGWETFTPAEDLAMLEKAVNPPQPDTIDKAIALGRDAKRGWIDSNDPLVPLQQATGIPVHDLAQLTADAAGGGEEIVRRVIRPLLQDVKDDLKWLEMYMVAKRNEDLMARNPSAKLPGGVWGWRGTMQAQEEIARRLGPERMKAIDRTANALWDADARYNMRLLKAEGILDSRTYNAMMSDNPHYIPWNRADFEGMLQGRGGGPSSVGSTGLKRLELAGSERALDKPLAHFVQKFGTTQTLVARNRAAKALVQSLRRMEKATGQELVRDVVTSTAARNVNITGQAKPLLTKAEHSKVWDTVSYFEDGKKIEVDVPAVYAEVAKGLGEESANALTTVARYMSAPLRYGAVSYNPVWPLVNTIMNSSSAWFREGVVPLGPDFIAALKAVVKKDKLWQEVAEQGILMRGFTESVADLTSMQRAAKASSFGGISVRNPKEIALILPRLLATPFKGIAEVSKASEQATRIAAYRKLTREGVAPIERAIRSKEVAVDFSKMGTTMRTVNAVIPFTNAALQGSLLIGRTVYRHPKWAAIAASPFITASVMSRVNNMRFETSQDIPAYEYTRNWVFQFGEGSRKDGTKFPLYIKIPKGPLAAGLTFPAEAVFNATNKADDKSLASFALEAALEGAKTVSPVEPGLGAIMPPAAQTLVGASLGKDLYTKQDIVPRREQGLLTEQQFGPETSRASVLLGQKTGISPRLLDWAIKDYSAGTGESVMALLSLGLDAAGYEPEVYGGALAEQPTTAEKAGYVPGVRRLYGTKSTERERQGWESFDRAVERTNKDFAAIPDVNRLGIRLGNVGDSIDLEPKKTGGSVDLTPQERAEYQGLMATAVLEAAKSWSIPEDTPQRQKEYVAKHMQVAKDKVHDSYVKTLRSRGRHLKQPSPSAPAPRQATATPTATGRSYREIKAERERGGTVLPTATPTPAPRSYREIKAEREREAVGAR